ncbi:MAG TPA: hypothetical protein VGM89_15800 [Puia sp.]
MQFKALIFTLCTLFYWVEYTAAPRMMTPSSTTPPGTTHACCQEAAGSKKQCPKEKQCPKGKECPKEGCNPTSDCCLNCPLCYTAILPTVAQHTTAQSPGQEYNLWASSYVYNYRSSCWKPPNAA